MKINDRIDCIRKEMKRNEVDAYIIPSTDDHMSEYVSEYWKGREWISGFTGSAGTIVITMKECLLWTDGRYHVQASKEILGSEIKLMKQGCLGVPTYPQWLAQVLVKKSIVGIDSRLFTINTIKQIEKIFNNKAIKIKGNLDLLSKIWMDRPNESKNKVFLLDESIAGESIDEKIVKIREIMNRRNIDYHILSKLDDIAWTLNIRGGDIKNNPIVVSYLLVGKNYIKWFVDLEKLSFEIINYLKNHNIEIESYGEFSKNLKSLNQVKIMIDPRFTSKWVFDNIKNCQIMNFSNPTHLMKAIKNPIEILNIKKAHIKDGVAMVRFIKWLEVAILNGKETELTAQNQLLNYRKKEVNFFQESFDTIAAYGENAAMMHYKAICGFESKLEPRGLFLVDSGGQYLEGTTDITRTFALGELTEEEKEDYTLVLKGHINLAKSKFLKGTRGCNLDILARQPIWEKGLDYKCGTGHGVGCFLNVHEGPQSISQNMLDVKLEVGMTITNEPGIYKTKKHGIRIENLYFIKPFFEGEFGDFFEFECLTYCPIDLEPVKIEELSQSEKKWINNYHFTVYETLKKYLSIEECFWLFEKTKAI